MPSLSEIAAKEVGYAEGANNANKFSKELGRPAESWCADFVSWCAKHSNTPTKYFNSASVMEWEKWALKNKLTVPWKEVQKDDIVIFDFQGDGKPDHIGIALGYNKNTKLVDTIEGNTSSNNTGSQANGDVVALKHRSPFVIRLVIRPK